MTSPSCLRVFCGPWKSGSSAVRAALSNISPRLAALGFSLPEGDLPGNALAAASRNAVAPFIRGLYDDPIAWEALAAAERQRNSAAGDVVAWSEFLHACAPSGMFAGRAGPRIAVAIVRPQVDVANSLVAELVNDPTIALDDARRLAVAHLVDYAAFEERWSAEGFDVRLAPYSRDVVPAAFERLEIPLAAPQAQPARTRPTDAAILHLYGRKAAHGGDPSWRVVCERFSEIVGARKGQGRDRAILLGEDAGREIDRRASESNGRLLVRHPELADVVGRAAATASGDAALSARRLDAAYALAVSRA